MEQNIISSEKKSKSLIENEFENLWVSPQGESYLLSTAKWSKFLAIVGFISIGIMIVVSVVLIGVSKTFGDYEETSMIPATGFLSYMWLFYILIAIISFFPTYYLLIFANKTKQAVADKNPVALEEGFRNMKRFAKFVGIVTIIFIALYAVVIIAVIIGSVAKTTGI